MSAAAAPVQRPQRPRRPQIPPRTVRWDRRLWFLGALVATGIAVNAAGANPNGVVNTRGWPQVSDFLSATVRPDLSADMVELALRESAVTVGYALVGTALALVIGVVGGVLLTERIWSPMHGTMGRGRVGWVTGRVLFSVPRSMHEVVFGLILVNVLGLDPLVAVLAIGIPFGAVTAKVFSELLDEVPRGAEMTLRASGAGRITALVFGTVPQALGDLLSYAFYRFECSLRSAAVLGIVGAGGLGFQLALSFQSLRYDQMWTFLWALIILSGIADSWSSAVRRRRNAAAVEMHVDRVDPVGPQRDRFLQFSALACAVAIPVAFWHLKISISNLWSTRARTLGGELVDEAWPPEIGTGGVAGLFEDSFDTIALAVLAIAIASLLASPLAFLAHRPQGNATGGVALVRRMLSAALRFFMLVCRSVPPPVWAFIVVFVLFPGLWPGAVALGIYNAGVLGRLQGEVIENVDQTPTRVLAASGASTAGAAIYATVPAVAGRFVALGLYRWEVAIRETVVVGTVGAAGLGRRLDDQTSSFNYDGILATILALLVVTVVVDVASACARRSIR